MRDAGVHRDDQIQLRYQRCGIGKILECVAAIKNIGALLENRVVVGTNVLLQADKDDFVTKASSSDTTARRPIVPGIARPHQANPGMRFSL